MKIDTNVKFCMKFSNCQKFKIFTKYFRIECLEGVLIKMSAQLSRNSEGIVPGLDYSTVDGLHRKRLLAFVNHFLTRTVDSLTVFSRVCDVKLASISGRIKKLEHALQLLEHKLASVPELNEMASINHVTEPKNAYTNSTVSQ
jgi:hypothetical protein